MKTKNGRGRPKNAVKHVKCAFQLTEKTYKAYKEYCEENCITKGTLFDKIVREYLIKVGAIDG